MDKLLPQKSCSVIRDCLNDVYIHLSNDLPDPLRRKALMSQCMQCIELIEKCHSDDRIDAPSLSTSEPAQYLGPDQPYLDMTKVSFQTSTPHKSALLTNEQPIDDDDYDPNATVHSEYVDVTSPSGDTSIVEVVNVNYANQKHDDANRKATSLGSSTQYDQLQFEGWHRVNFNSPSSGVSEFLLESTLDPEECPFGGLPATHLRMRQCSHIGWLTEPRRYLPKKSKRYYAGVLDGWLIMYSGGESAIRPSCSYLLRRCSWTDTQESMDRFRLTLTSDMGKKKKRHFQMNQEDLTRWIVAFADTKPAVCVNLFGARKLPTPPPSVDTKTEHQSSVHSNAVSSAASTVSLEVDATDPMVLTDRNAITHPKVEEIYEEPVELLASLNKLKAQQRATQLLEIEVQQEYDIPKPKPRPVNSDLLQPKPTTPPANNSPTIPASSDENSFQENKSRVAAKLSVPTNPATNPALRKKTSSIKDVRTETRNSRRRSSISSWLYRLSRRGRRSVVHSVTKTGEPNCIPEDSADDIRASPMMGVVDQPGTPWAFGSPMKGGKVNQIISQLEANGHRVAINRSKANKLNGGKKATAAAGIDDHNYEPVSVVTT